MRYFAVFIICFYSICIFGQQISPNELSDDDSPANFFEIQGAINQYYQDHPGEKGEKLWRRKEWFLEPRLYPSGEMENLALKTLRAYDRYVRTHSDQRATHAHWSFIGPLNVQYSGPNGHIGIGRVNCFAIHPSNSNIIYIGSPNGGIWKTTNGGGTWTDVSPNLPLLSINGIGLDPQNPNIIFALTGDGDPVINWWNPYPNCETRSIGVIYSADAGASWYPTGLAFDYTSPVIANKLLIHPVNADTQFVATETGIYRTTNRWVTNFFTPMSLYSQGVTYDIEFHPTNPQIMYCAGRDWIRKSINGGLSWGLKITDPDFAIMDNAFRVELAVTPDLPSAVYALVGGGQPNVTRALFKSLLEGANNTWTIQDSSTELISAQSPYNIGLAVKTTDHNDVIAGGVESWISSNSGLSWDTTTYGIVHPDVHEIQYQNGAWYMATDGGLFKSTNDGMTWINLWAGLGITEVYRISGTPQDPDLSYCGNQDNGVLKRSGSTTYTFVLGGDGMVTQINYLNPDTVYGCVQNGDCVRSFDGFQSWSKMIIPCGPGSWISPMEIDPVDPSIIFVARDSLYRSNNHGANGSWTFLGQPTGFELNCMKQGTNNRNRMYVSQGALIQRTDNALTSPGPALWTDVSPGLPNLFITGIAIDPTDANDVYVCLSGYIVGQKVYKSANGGSGSSWTNISGSLPNVPLNCIVFHNNGSNGLYVGTDIGVFYRDDNLGDWIYYSNNMPLVTVSDLYINTTSNKIVAGTYGRGLWQADLFNACDATLTLGPGNLGGVRYYSVTNWISSTHDYDPDLGTNIHYNAGNYIDLKPGFEVNGIGFFEGKIGPCPPIYEEPLIAPEQHGSPFFFSEEALKKLYRTE